MPTHDGDIYCRVPINGHFDNYLLSGDRIRSYLSDSYRDATGNVPQPNAISAALLNLEGRALKHDQRYRVCTRVGGSVAEGKVYLDLANSTGEYVEIDADGWHIKTNPPFVFRRPKGIKALPHPVSGKIDPLRPLLNCGSDEGFKLIVGFLVAALHPDGPYFLLSLEGGQGSGKSSLARYLIGLIDPQAGEKGEDDPLRKLPKDPKSLFVVAKSSWLQPYDNFSHLSSEFSDDLCRLSTGGRSAERALHTNDEVHSFSVKRPVILTSIPRVVTRPDLRERSIILTLSEPSHRIEEAFLNQRFEEVRPVILGALCDAISSALREWQRVSIQGAPRMADAVRWVEAAAPALGWQPGEFLALFRQQQSEVMLEAIAEDPIAQAMKKVVEKAGGSWHGCSRELLFEINDAEQDMKIKSARSWPINPRAMTDYLTRNAAELQRAGIQVMKGEHTVKGIPYTLTLNPNGQPGSDEANGGSAPVRDDLVPAPGARPGRKVVLI